MKQKHQPLPSRAIDRLRETAPDGPAFLGVLLDEQSMRCLAAGVVNSRAEVAARKVLAVFEGKQEHTA